MSKILLTEQAEPDSPSSGKIAYYCDEADGNMKVKKSNGTVVNLETGQNPFDQDLNTTDSPTFNDIKIANDILHDKQGEYKIKDGANTSYGWKDLTCELTARGGNQPSWAQYRNGIYHYRFSYTSIEELWGNFHVNHDYANGTKMYMHMHWSPNTTTTGTVRWGFEYTVAKGHGQQSYPSTTTVYVEQTISTDSQYKHMIAEVSEADAIPSTNLEVDSVIMMRVFRDSTHANDTFNAEVFGFFVDCHYQSATISTKNKAPNFYT